MTRPPDLRQVPLPEALSTRCRVVTMAAGQWDSLLHAAYEAGWILLELDDDEQPVAAYQRRTQ